MTDDEHLDETRVMELARALGYDSVRQLEQAAKSPPNNLQKYMDGKAKPNSNVLLRLTEVLGAPPSYLYGRSMDAVRKNILAMVRRAFGADEANALAIFAEMTSEQKRSFLRMLDAFAGHDHVPSAFERDAMAVGAKPAARGAASSKKK